MNIFHDFTTRLKAAVELIASQSGIDDVDVGRIVVEPPRDPSHGDLACNAAMVLAKPMGVKPRDLATRIAAVMAEDPDVDAAEVAGPGFINLRVSAGYWHKALRQLIQSGDAFGRSDMGGGEAVNVEYVSANPTGPMHIGHCRGAVVGDVLANLLSVAGFAVTREYYINDAGAQVEVLARSAYLRYLEALGETIGEIPEGLYPGDYLKPVGEALAREHGDILIAMPEEEWLPIVRVTTIDAMMAMIRDDLALLNIVHKVFFSERTLTEGSPSAVEAAIEKLSNDGLVYEGRLPPPKGQLPEDWEDREQLLFRSTAFGDDVDRPLKKSDGTPTYFASDIAYHYDKLRRGFRHLIDVWGADHGGYVKRMQAAIKAISGGDAHFEVKLVQIVRLLSGGEPVKMSKRSGDFITLRELVDRVGPDPIRFMMVFRKNDAQLDFDFEKVTEQSKDNPVFYVQYAHARTCSVFRQAATEMPDLDVSDAALASAPFDHLTDVGELAIIRRLLEFPRMVEAAAEAQEPHRIAYFIHELASDFHGHWNRGKELPQLRFINHTDPHSTLARLALVHATKLVLSSGLAILGVSAPEEMR
ncbi:arginine--tRNA ligase [Bauldia litoralis]|uniref:Arginine--tRNA ligase n=1 Tax=Bauldia litoralis TaxID=665467 RepID=A0A1G6ATR3_9HYPH|nr:arginine--tRNA ligase [Bauldia litoralis]SDB11748.1 arginyl-tRNA synthetase [Bauldia litoralis]